MSVNNRSPEMNALKTQGFVPLHDHGNFSDRTDCKYNRSSNNSIMDYVHTTKCTGYVLYRGLVSSYATKPLDQVYDSSRQVCMP